MTDNETKIDKDRVVPRSSIKRRSLRIIDRASKTNTTKQSFENECFQGRRKGVGTNRAIERKWRCSVDKKKKKIKLSACWSSAQSGVKEKSLTSSWK